jgi:protein-disulfide isomerase
MHAFLVLAAALSVLACQKPASAPAPAQPDGVELALLAQRVDKMDRRLARIEKALGGEARPEPEPDVTYSIPIDGDPSEGPADARVTIVKGFEFACGYCYKVRPTLSELVASYKGDVRVVYKYYVVHDQAVIPGLAACAAHKQGKFHEMTELIWEKAFAAEDLGEEKMTELATELGLDMTAYETDMRGEACMSWLKGGYQTLADLGVRGTPSFFINGRFLSGAQPIGVFRTIIDAELARANAAIAKGTSPATYYQKHVVEAGAKELE